MRFLVTAAAVLLCGLAASAQQPEPKPVKRTDQPPVVLLNGYQIVCSSQPVASSDTFGRLEALLAESGREVRFFDNCRSGRVSIQKLSQDFATFLAALKYEDDGTPVPQVDLIGHSMGGLIARCYLAGCREDGGFLPPVPKRVRKLITIGTPHFGADFGGFSAPDAQAGQMVPGTRFLFDLATWNQFRDDLRGVDALGIAGRSQNRASDGLVSALSASAYFAYRLPPERTRVIVGCHTTGIAGIFLGCAGNEPGIAAVTGSSHPTWRLISGFLSADRDSWMDLFRADDDSELSAQSSLFLTYTASSPDSTVEATLDGAPLSKLPNSPVRFVTRTPQREGAQVSVTVDSQPVDPQFSITLGRGVTTMALKSGPAISAVDMAFPAADGKYSGPGKVLVATPGAWLRISGANLDDLSEAYLGDTPLERDGLLVRLPDDPLVARPGASVLRIKTPAGEDRIRVFFGPSPARFVEAPTGPGAVSWTPVEGATAYALWIGSEAGKSDLLDLWKPASETSAEIPAGLPEGVPLYIRLWTQYDGDWYYREVVLGGAP
jgi:pimeloyl-ACP methyl ester carboxylesterase